MIKKTIIRVIVIVLVFFGSFACFSRLMNSDNIDKTMKLADCTLPVISAYCGDEQINYMSGYTKQMQGQYMRDTITPLDSENKLDIQINTFGETIQSVAFVCSFLYLLIYTSSSYTADKYISSTAKHFAAVFHSNKSCFIF